MNSNREVAGVGLAFVGFAFLVLGFKGTWSQVWHDLFKGGTSANTAKYNSVGNGQVPGSASPGWPGQIQTGPNAGKTEAGYAATPPGFPNTAVAYNLGSLA